MVPRARSLDQDVVSLERGIRSMLEGYLGGRRLVSVKIGKVEGTRVNGFLKIREDGELSLVDFHATTRPGGGVSSLEVGGKKVTSGQGPKHPL